MSRRSEVGGEVVGPRCRRGGLGVAESGLDATEVGERVHCGRPRSGFLGHCHGVAMGEDRLVVAAEHLERQAER